MSVKLRCDERFTHVFTACGCVFKVIMLVGSNRGNYFENDAACSKRRWKRVSQRSLRIHVPIHICLVYLEYEHLGLQNCGRCWQVVVVVIYKSKVSMGPKNGGRYTQLVAIRSWSFSQILLYLVSIIFTYCKWKKSKLNKIALDKDLIENPLHTNRPLPST